VAKNKDGEHANNRMISDTKNGNCINVVQDKLHGQSAAPNTVTKTTVATYPVTISKETEGAPVYSGKTAAEMI
jgi:hypothetical protein